MGTSRSHRHTTKPGPASVRLRKLHGDPDERQDSFFAANRISAAAEKYVIRIAPDVYLPTLDGGTASTTSGPFIITLDADPSGNGLEMTTGGYTLKTGPNSGDDAIIRHLMPLTPTSDKRWCMRAQIQVDDADKIGFFLGVTATTTDPINTDPSDFIAIRKAPTSANIIGRVNGNGGTVRDTGTLATCGDATVVEVGFNFYMDATTPAGEWWVNGVVTAFTANQLTALAAIMTTPPSLYAILAARTGEAASHTLSTADFNVEVDK